jgi:hypothetical protein
MTDERRRLVFGNGELDHLDPFVIDIFGRIYNSQSDSHKAKEQFDRKEAAKRWQRALTFGTGRKPAPPDMRMATEEDMINVKETELKLVRGPIPNTTNDPEHEQWNAVIDECTTWKFLDRTPRLLGENQIKNLWRDKSVPIRDRVKMTTIPARIISPDWIPIAGDVDSGWAVLRMKDRFLTLFHGPSMAGRIFK